MSTLRSAAACPISRRSTRRSIVAVVGFSCIRSSDMGFPRTRRSPPEGGPERRDAEPAGPNSVAVTLVLGACNPAVEGHTQGAGAIRLSIAIPQDVVGRQRGLRYGWWSGRRLLP